MAKKDDAMQGLCLPRATCGRAHNSHNLQHSTFNAALTIKIIIIIFKLICKLPNRARTELNLTQKERERESERECESEIHIVVLLASSLLLLLLQLAGNFRARQITGNAKH